MQLNTTQEKLLQIIGAAASLPERAHADHFVPRRVPFDAAWREKWLSHTSRGNEAHFHALMSARGIADTSGLLSDVRVKEAAPLPAWGIALARLLSDSAADGALPLRASWHEQYRVALAFVPIAACAIESVVSQSGVAVDVNAKQDLLEWLLKRWTGVTRRVVDVETRVNEQAGIQLDKWTSRAGWLELCELYPVLGRLLGLVFHEWEGACTQLLRCLSNDADAINRCIFGRAPAALGALASVQAEAGDVHRGGRATMIIELAGGRKLVFKPKDLRIAGWFSRVVAVLNAAPSLPLTLRQPALVEGDGYLWEEFVTPAACKTAAELNDFYVRYGELLALTQVLGGTDLHFENWIANGAELHLIDVEALFTPTAAPQTWELAVETEISRVLQVSPLTTGLLPEWRTAEPGELATAQGGLVAGLNVPALPGEEPVLTAADVDAVVFGYRAMRECLHLERDSFLGPKGFLAEAAALPTRFIPRMTQTYAKFLYESTVPARLRDGRERDLFLEQLYFSCTGAEDVTLRLIEEEIAALRALDIPLFTSRPGSRCVYGEASEIADYFPRSPLDDVRDRFDQLVSSIEFDADLVRSTLATLPCVRPCASDRWPRTALDIDPLELAISIGDEMLSQAISREGALAWIGRVSMPVFGIEQVRPLHPDVLSGQAGLAIVFSELACISGKRRFHDAAQATLQSVRVRLERVVTSGMDAYSRPRRNQKRHWFFCGLFTEGVATQLWTLARCAKLLGRPELGDEARRWFAMIPFARLLPFAPHDLTSGLAGLIVTALELGPAAMSVAQAAADVLVATRAEGKPWIAPYPRGPLPQLPGTEAGIELALTRLAQATDREYSRACIDAESWRTAGDLLVALALKDEPSSIIARADAFARTAFDDAPSITVLDQLEVSLALLSSTNERMHEHRARALLGCLAMRRAELGTWFPECIGSHTHRLSALFGTAAIARSALRLVVPAIGSLRVADAVRADAG